MVTNPFRCSERPNNWGPGWFVECGSLSGIVLSQILGDLPCIEILANGPIGLGVYSRAEYDITAYGPRAEPHILKGALEAICERSVVKHIDQEWLLGLFKSMGIDSRCIQIEQDMLHDAMYKVLQDVRIRLAKGWSRFRVAQDAQKNPVDPCSPDAESWCLTGAVEAAINSWFEKQQKYINYVFKLQLTARLDWYIKTALRERPNGIAPHSGGLTIDTRTWNDHPNTSLKDIFDLLNSIEVMISERARLGEELFPKIREFLDHNWDGYGATAVSRETYYGALDLLYSIRLEKEFSDPDWGAEPDGSITMEWYQDPKHLTSVSIERGGRWLAYAATIGDEKIIGNCAYPKNRVLPQDIKNIIREVLQQTVPTP